MTLEIDISKLKSRRSDLTTELQKINDLITLAEQYSVVVPERLPQPALPVYSNGNKSATQEPHRGFTAGLRRAVILALHTGPSTESDLTRALAWPAKRTKAVVMSMLKFRICYLSEHGRLTLTDEGKKQAQFYLNNPDFLTFRPSSAGAKKQTTI